MRAEQGAADQRAPAEPGLLAAVLEHLDERRRACVVGAAQLMPLLDRPRASGISFLAQWIAPAPMRNSARPSVEAEGQVGVCAPTATTSPSFDREREVRHDEAEACQCRQREHARDLALGPPLGPSSVSARRSQVRAARPGSGIGSATVSGTGRPVGSTRRRPRRPCAGHLAAASRVAHRRLGPDPDGGADEAADADQPAQRPSGTGPSAPDAEAAGVRLSSTDLRKPMMSRFSSGSSVSSLNTGIDCGPVSIAS